MNLKSVLQTRVLAFALSAFLLTSCDNPNKDLKNAEQVNTEQAYQEFIQKHPESPLVAQAQAGLEEVVYVAAKRDGSPAAFERFLTRFPKSSLVGAAQADLESAEFASAITNRTVASWRTFLAKYPRSIRIEAASSNLCELSFKAAADGNTAALWESFLKTFPASPHFGEATQKLARLVWKDASKSNTISAYESFLSRFGGTPFSNQAKSALSELEYQAATNSDTVEDYKSFLQRFPNSEFTLNVKQRLKPLIEEQAWNEALLKNTPQGYLTFATAHPHSPLAVSKKASDGAVSASESLNGGSATIALYRKNGEKYSMFAIAEIKGRLEVNGDGIVDGIDSLQRLQFQDNGWTSITDRELIRGNAIITTENGNKYVVFNLQGFAGQIEPAESKP